MFLGGKYKKLFLCVKRKIRRKFLCLSAPGCCNLDYWPHLYYGYVIYDQANVSFLLKIRLSSVQFLPTHD